MTTYENLPPREKSQRIMNKTRKAANTVDSVPKSKSSSKVRHVNSSGVINSGTAVGQIQKNVYPGLNDIADAFEAFPQELIRYFTLLKEIDAKCVYTVPYLKCYITRFLEMDKNHPKRELLLFKIRQLIKELMPCLEEKMHVASIAVDTVLKNVGRIEDDYNEIVKNEIPESIRIGPLNHPAMIADNKIPDNKSAQSQRSESRREALAARKAAAAQQASALGAGGGSGGSGVSGSTGGSGNAFANANDENSGTDTNNNASSVSNKKSKNNKRDQQQQQQQQAQAQQQHSSGSHQGGSRKRKTNHNDGSEVSRPGTPANPTTIVKRRQPSKPKKSPMPIPTSQVSVNSFKVNIPTNHHINDVDRGDNDEHIVEPITPTKTESGGNMVEPVYCYCQQVSFGEMVGCDGDDCKREWFHLPCIGLTDPPKGKWYCSDCLARMKKNRK
ncbi:hypothetical protein PACTADRAFT_51875 [Pachysolen tannophilus NRRL Y-2460]|uniref:Chromatin modification-related protein n=1 Tax=Pachysolen tannophilus NRRL Y-2460 TaxID=669874 RepID=A0A1E4TNF5_PACTA|nr:hypothetical protein PACTADRAFT_51875 [Pachysolen tannophilus NRRL Y-2460]